MRSITGCAEEKNDYGNAKYGVLHASDVGGKILKNCSLMSVNCCCLS